MKKTKPERPHLKPARSGDSFPATATEVRLAKHLQEQINATNECFNAEAALAHQKRMARIGALFAWAQEQGLPKGFALNESETHWVKLPEKTAKMPSVPAPAPSEEPPPPAEPPPLPPPEEPPLPPDA